MGHPKVSWIMPVRNAGATLDAALDSIAAQDYPRHELLVWDDGSTDDTPDILRRWLGRELPGRVVGSGRVGIGRALGYLVASAESELLARADADDLNEPRRLTRQAEYLVENRKVGVLGAQMRDLATGEVMTDLPTADADIRWALRFTNPVNHPTVMLRRSAVLEVGNYRDLRPGQDYDLWVRLAVICRFANLPEPQVRYRVHDASVSAAQRGDGGEAFYKLRDALVDRLLPGTEPGAAVRLLHLVRDTGDLNVAEDDLRRFRRAAMLAARACRYDPSYFMQTALFRQQQANLRTRHLKGRPVVRACLPLLRSARGLAQKLHHKHSPTPTQRPEKAA